VPVLAPLRLDHERRDQQRNGLGEQVAQSFYPLLPVRGKDVGAELPPGDRQRDDRTGATSA
jgi:hypothetical protein